MRILRKNTEKASIGSSMLKELVSGYRGRLAILAIVSFVGALLEALFLVIITGVAMALVAQKTAVGPVLGHSTPVGAALLVAALVLVVRLLLNLVGVWISASLTEAVTTEQRQILSHAYLRASWAVQQAEPAGRLQELLTTFVVRVNNTISTLAQAVTALLSLFAFLGTGLFVDAVSTLAVLVALGLVGAILTPLRRRIRRRSGAAAGAGLSFANSVSELGSLGLEMQAFGVQGPFAQRIDQLTHEAAGTQRKVQILSGSLAPIYMSLAYAAVLTGVAILSVVGVGNLTVIGAVMLLMLRSLSYGQQLASASGSLAANSPFLDQVRQTVERYTASPATTGGVIPASVAPLEAHNVEFAYSADRLALRDATFRLDLGEVVGVIGPSGAGKSTLAQLLLGLREPISGSLRVDGTDLRKVDRAWWNDRVAFVAQDALLFTGTIAENIRFFRDGINDSALMRAARQANILSDIEALQNGFDSHLGERGSQLSGGQRQRLSIARALAGSPEFLVLDEPTSALDGHSEALIRDTLARLKGRVTVVIIAHRMSTLDICDRIMVIEDGRMTALDVPSVLGRKNRFYRNAMAVAGVSQMGEPPGEIESVN
jgi:ABC-type multidrug transport system fused ATPase/permease subunit